MNRSVWGLSRGARWKSRRRGCSHREMQTTLEMLEPRHLLAGDLAITEFQAINVSTLQDEDGDFSDWIEIRNDSNQPVDLQGWYLTDNSDELMKWQFPVTSLAANDEIVVFASGKNRGVAGQELHTSFKLSGGGEYLGLVDPDGQVSQEFGPEYLPQVPDNSYGLGVGRVALQLLDRQTTVRSFVPVDDSLGEDWTALGYDDGQWHEGIGPTGFERPLIGSEELEEFTGELGADWNIDLPGDASSRVAVEDGRLVLELPPEQLLMGENGRGLAPLVLRDLPANTNSFSLVAEVESGMSRGNTGVVVFDAERNEPILVAQYEARRQFAMRGADGVELDTARKPNRNSYFIRVDFDHVVREWTSYYKVKPEDDWAQIAAVREGERGLGTPVDLRVGFFAESGSRDVAVSVGSFAISRPAGFVYESSIGNSVESSMYDQNSSIFLRAPFELDVDSWDPAMMDGLNLSTEFDDGFRLFLNGVEVASHHSPDDARWNAQATGSHDASLGVIPSRSFDLSEHLDLLKPGNNVLAVQGLNNDSADADFYFAAELTALQTAPLTEQQFTHPTPGDLNPAPALPSPQILGEQGAFVDTRMITVENVAGPNTEIRYTLDGQDPTATSALYQGPIPISKTTMFQARAFDLDENGRDPSPLVGGTYLAFTPDLMGRKSDLPILVLDTLSQDIPKTESTELTAANALLYDLDSETNASSLGSGDVGYLGRAGIRVRGSTTRGQAKPNLTFETWGVAGFQKDDDVDVSLVGLPSDSDWVLHAPFVFDRALIRNQVFFDLSRGLLDWSPRTRPIEVYLNRDDDVISSDDYAGMYVVIEKVKRSPDRVDIQPITPADSDPNSQEISGGYIWKVDRGDPEEPPFNAGGRSLNWVYPKSAGDRSRVDQQVTAEQEAWVQSYFEEFAATLETPDLNDPTGYSHYIDVDSWINAHLVNVLSFNVDAMRLSTYLFKDRGGKIEYGPLWDCDRCMESVDDRDDDPTVWSNPGGTDFFTTGPHHDPWFSKLFQDPNFWQLYIDRWSELRQTVWSSDGLDQIIDRHAAPLADSSQLDADRWNRKFRGSSVFDSGVLDKTWEGEVEHLRMWLHARAEFMDQSFVSRPELFVGNEESGSLNEIHVAAGTEIAISPAQMTFPGERATLTGPPESTIASYFVPSDDSLGESWTTIDFDDSAWSTGQLGLGFDSRNNLTEHIQTEVPVHELVPSATNLLVRIPFELAEMNEVADKAIKLSIKFDDGFAAYLNGQRIASRNLRDEVPAWDALANTRGNEAAVEFLEFDVSEHRQALIEGTNVLAIQLVNAEDKRGDLLLVPELVSQQVTVGGNPAAKVYVTTDGSDPRSPDGLPSQNAIEWDANQKFTVNENVRLIARTLDSSDRGPEAKIVLTDWSAPTALKFVVEEADVVISEVNYNPADATEAEAAAGYGNDDFEFLEIHNRGGAAADLVGMRLTDGIEFDFLDAASIQPGGHAVVVRNADAFQMRYGQDVAVIGVYEGSLSNAGEDIDLVDGAGNVLFSVNYSDNDPWPVRADGFGATLELADVNGVNAATRNKWYSWQASSENGGSPGQAGSGPAGVVINEVVANTNGDLEDSIELHNVTEAAIDISGWLLSDSAGDRDKFSIPAGTNLAAGGYIVFDEGDFNADTPVGNNESFALGRTGDSVWLTKADGSFVDDVHFGETKANTSLGRMPNGSGRLAPFSQTTFGAQNASPSVGPLVISEVNYNPRASEAALAADPTLETSDLEYIKLHNSSASEIDLTNWRVRGGTDYNFDDGVKIGAGESLILLKFNPDNPENINQVNAFKAHYGLDESARLVGGYAGLLNNSDDRVTLLRPDTPAEDTPNEIPHVIEDEVLYDDLAPWPTEADGTGRALSRVSLTAFGNVASSWVAGALPESLASELSGDFNGDGTLDAGDINLLFAEIRNGTNDATYDLNGDSLVNTADRDVLVKTLIGADYGDANLDGVFDSNDLVTIFIAGEFEDGVALNSGWETGDWDGDGDFGSGDLVIAFQDGGYAAAGPLGAHLDMARIGGALAEGPEAQFTDGLLTTASTTSQPLSSQVEVELIDEMVESLFDNDQLADDKGTAIDDVAGALVDDGMSI